jgi:non-heme chloroperoxidase
MASATPVVFIHGLWLHASSWGPWLELFRSAGYDPVAPGWPGEPDTVDAARANPDTVAGFGINEVSDHFAKIAESLPAKPIVIGHSFGGLLVQNLLGRGLGRAGVAIDPAPVKGVLALPLSALRVASIALRNPTNVGKTVGLSLEQFTYGFANNRTPAEASSLYDSWAMPSPGKPLFQAASANFNLHAATTVDLHNSHRGTLLITLGGKDQTVPPAISRSTYKLHRKKSSAVTELHEFPDADHSLTVDSDWRRIADDVLAWLTTQGR